MTNRGHHAGRVAGIALTGVAVFAWGTPTALADDGDDGVEQPPGYEAPATPEVDPDAAGLKLGDGATLAEPRVLDIKRITENLGTGEQSGADGGTGGDSDGSGDAGDPGDSGDAGDSGETGGEGDGGQSTDSGGSRREEQTGNTHKFTLQTDVIFGEGSDEITEASADALREVAAAIDEYQPSQVNIFGFTDDQGSYESGVTLSTNRARNTQQVLLGLIEDPSGIQFNVRGYSEDYPLYDNSTEEGRQRNRRVEISWPTEE
ncbi:OmpA family protein [Streptomyces hoynatensis]|uniref:OmpA family protein n=1 Tax=Streptomyces hoynatensis TaxID=1141874 RepID=A0A3A9ZFL7_9ACTN|nr:OmpA family protein [Streptomyces hoynatensis]RKN46989.1 OmpA family protein [Streptomyces hoynatensis]